MGERRDGFLVGGAGIYGLGYLVWSYNARYYHLGQLPALEFQYIIAGLVPAMLIVIAWLLVTSFPRLSDKAIPFFDRHIKLLWALLITCLLSMAAFFASIALSDRWINTGRMSTRQALALSTTLFLLFLLLSFFLALMIKRKRILNSFYKFLTVSLFLAVSLAFYIQVLYPVLPQELGGTLPRCAYIDFARQDVAPASLAALLPPNSTADGAGTNIVRSQNLVVFFANRDFLLVRTASDIKQEDLIEKIPLYELRRDSIHLIKWCS